MNPEEMRVLLKEMIKENLTIEVRNDSLFGTLEIELKFDDELITSASVYRSDVENLLRKDLW
ncbi:hypothetical protein VPA32_orf092 [Klebsiella phage vB_KpnM_VPA32]|uniref:Uncharacterized protein n=2 Tax=Karamvirus pg7 TaxID=1913655 RepID=A0A5B9NM32_9CAUD|nr:hypothetical protein CG98_gp089 [Enterobacter phage PG7]AHI60992.1 hypothetical protein PG7_089 [Enterobacter phage PG7]QEG13130.1 hypothetical protein KAALPHA_93 [Klebsiella phage vB_KaeM_KaAlpha]WJJ59057.1 hypothetical protein VPA32_orf092 [Klebsiella phage vB_KpnM_VPA32]